MRSASWIYALGWPCPHPLVWATADQLLFASLGHPSISTARERGVGLSTSGCRCRLPPPQSQRHLGRSVNRGFVTTTAAFGLLPPPLPSPLREDEQRRQHRLERRPTQRHLEATSSLCIGAAQLLLLVVLRLRSSPSASPTRRGTVGKRIKKEKEKNK